MRSPAEIAQELWDREQIREVIARYCRAVDRAMIDDAKAVYFDDATEDHGVYRGPGLPRRSRVPPRPAPRPGVRP